VTDATTRPYDIDVDVERGVVTLSGDVETDAQRQRAVELARGVVGVERVENEIEIDPNADDTIADRLERGLAKTGEAITDGWITTKVHWFFLGEDVLEDSDIDVDTNDGVVTLSGTVRSDAARARAKALAEMTDGVDTVRDQLKVVPE
jgi:osmotically-inducible protein OsmY